MGNLETLVAYELTDDDGEKTIELYINTKQLPDTDLPESNPTHGWVLEQGAYPLTEVTRWYFTAYGLEDILRGITPFPEMNRFLQHAYALNVRLMRNGGTMFSRFHNEHLATDLITSSVRWGSREWVDSLQITAEPAPEEAQPNVELRAFELIRGICIGTCPPSELHFRKLKSYGAVLYRNNNRKTVARLYFDRPQPAIGVFNPAGKETRYKLGELEEIADQARRLRARVRSLRDAQ